jgi:DNA polymerase-3 subunit alpha
MREKLMKNLTIKLPVDKVNAKWINDIIEVVKNANMQKEGTCTLKFKIYDPADPKLNIDLPSKKYRVNPHNELIDELEKIAELEY